MASRYSRLILSMLIIFSNVYTMSLMKQQQPNLEDKQPLMKKGRSHESDQIKNNIVTTNGLSDRDGLTNSKTPLLGKHLDDSDDGEELEDTEHSIEGIDTRVAKTSGDIPNDDVRNSTGSVSNRKNITEGGHGKRLFDNVTSPEISGNKDATERRGSLQCGMSISSSNKELFRKESMDRNIESLVIGQEDEESSVLTTPTPMSTDASNPMPHSTEDSPLLQPLRPVSNDMGDDFTTDRQEDEESIHSTFRGALDVHVLEIPWESDINRVVDVQTGETEWNTNINPVEGGLCIEGWESSIIEMSTEADKFGLDIWNTAIHQLPKGVQLHSEWSTEIAGKMTNDDNPADWSTKFNSIEKVEQSKNIWTTMVRKIQNRREEAEQWKTTFNAIGAETNKQKTGWKFKIPKRMLNLSLKTDWSTRINHIERSVEGDIWNNKFSRVLLQCDDRETHWSTKFSTIQQSEDHVNSWDTSFREIAPRDTGQPEIWSTSFYSISEERDLPEHWNTKFTSIEQPADGNDWSITIEDVPDNFREPSDWTTGFNGIENHENNMLWDTIFNSITKDHASERMWSSNFLQADISDISRLEWETNLNPIDKADITWEVSVHPIMNHPTNNPVDRG